MPDYILLHDLNESQRMAVTSPASVILCLAGAGSGKTTVLTRRVAYLHKEHRIGTSNMLCLTFTRLAAKELKERVMKLIGKEQGKQLFVGTFHAFAVSVLREWGSVLGIDKNFTIYDDEDRKSIIEKIIQDFGSRTNLKKVMERFALIKDVNLENEKYSEECRVLVEYGYRAKRNNAVDLDRLIDLVNHLFNLQPKSLDYYKNIYTHVFVDEFQDTNDEQMELIRHLDPKHLFIVGDDFQCQPPGTLINTPQGVVPIEKLQNGDKVLSWNRKYQFTTGKGFKIQIAKRQYSGDLIRISANSNSTKTTPNHKFLVRWVNRNTSIYVTYLMYRSDRGYRVGWCQLFNKNKGILHVAQRARLEKADNLWVLGIHANKRDASVQESIISFKYGIPTCMFEPNGDLYNEEALSRIFANAKPGGAIECFKDYGLHPNLPFWPYPNKRDNSGRPTYFECYACNILPEYMSIPLPSSKEHMNQWTVIKSKEREYFSGLVYSLDVETHHNYIADGLVTLNSIYGWRGAKVEYIIDFPIRRPECQVVKLEDNYRSSHTIVEAANKVIKNNTRQTEKKLIAHKDGPKIEMKEFTDEYTEAYGISQLAKIQSMSGTPYGDIAVLARTNAQIDRVKRIMDQFEIPAQRISGDDPMKKKDIKSQLAWLELYINPRDNVTLKKAAEFPKKYFSPLELQQIEFTATANDVPMLDAIEKIFPDHEFLTDYNNMNGIQGSNITDCYREFIERMNLKEFYSQKGLENRRKDCESAYGFMMQWERSRETLGEDTSLSAYLKWVKYRDMQEKLFEQKDAVKLMTIHAAKGLEFNTVIVAGLTQGIFPSHKSDDPEEERRLFYVAITRAKEKLILTYPNKIEGYNGQPREAEPSQYIGEAVGL